MGMINVKAKTNFERKVTMVDSQISLVVWRFSASSEMWMPKASESASAMAMTMMPPITTVAEPVLECNPTIKPRVVMMPEVKPKLKPFLTESFMGRR